MAETPSPLAQRLKLCKGKAGQLTTPSANPAIQNVKSFAKDSHFWKDPQANASLRRGILDADAKVAFKTIHTLCLPSELVVVDETGSCGYLVGVDQQAAMQLAPGHPVLASMLVLPDLTIPTILLVQQPCLQVDFFGRIKRLDAPLTPLSDADVEVLFAKYLPVLAGLQISCIPFLFDQSAECRRPALRRLEGPLRGVDEGLSEEETREDMVYKDLDGDYDAWSTPPPSTFLTPRIRPLRTLADLGIDLQLLDAKHQVAPAESPIPPPLGPRSASGLNGPPHNDSTSESRTRISLAYSHDGSKQDPDEGGEHIRSVSPTIRAADDEKVLECPEILPPINRVKRQRDSPPKTTTSTAQTTTPPRESKKAKIVNAISGLFGGSPKNSPPQDRDRHGAENGEATPGRRTNRETLLTASSRFIQRAFNGSRVGRGTSRPAEPQLPSPSYPASPPDRRPSLSWTDQGPRSPTPQPRSGQQPTSATSGPSHLHRGHLSEGARTGKGKEREERLQRDLNDMPSLPSRPPNQFYSRREPPPNQARGSPNLPPGYRYRESESLRRDYHHQPLRRAEGPSSRETERGERLNWSMNERSLSSSRASQYRARRDSPADQAWEGPSAQPRYGYHGSGSSERDLDRPSYLAEGSRGGGRKERGARDGRRQRDRR